VRGKVTTPKKPSAVPRGSFVPTSSRPPPVATPPARALCAARGAPAWIFPSADSTFLDESNERKAFNRILDKAELHRRGPLQMRYTFASQLLQAGEPITYVSRQLGHKDPSITLRVYAHSLHDTTRQKGVNRLDEHATTRNPDATNVAMGGLEERAKGSRKTNSQMGRDRVVPFLEDLPGLEAECLKLLRRGLYAGRIVVAIQVRCDRQT
jgi:hypothetical protein